MKMSEQKSNKNQTKNEEEDNQVNIGNFRSNIRTRQQVSDI